MMYLKDKPYHFNKPVLTMGNFDGIHAGHQKLLKLVVRRAKQLNGESVVITYYHHPFETLQKSPFPYLLTERDAKEARLKQLGVDHVLFLHFDEEVAAMSAEDFLQHILIDLIHPSEIIVGHDSHFGKGRCGNYEMLKSHEMDYHYLTRHVPPVTCGDIIISSTLIRDALREGKIEDATKYLGCPYPLAGKVVHGMGIGHELGFPTTNLQVEDTYKLIPKQGIYLTAIYDESGNRYFGLTNIGFSPTVKTLAVQEIETHLLDFEGDLYDQKLELLFLHRLRDEQKFSNRQDLRLAIARDVEEAKILLPSYKKRIR